VQLTLKLHRYYYMYHDSAVVVSISLPGWPLPFLDRPVSLSIRHSHWLPSFPDGHPSVWLFLLEWLLSWLGGYPCGTREYYDFKLLIIAFYFSFELGSGLQNREYGRGDPLRWPRDTLSPQKLALTSPASGGRSVDIVRLRANTSFPPPPWPAFLLGW
jgi:hypothetical protein